MSTLDHLTGSLDLHTLLGGCPNLSASPRVGYTFGQMAFPGPSEFTTGSRGWEPLSGPQFVFGADGSLLPLQSFLFQGVSGTFLVLSWHLPQDISGRQSRGGPGRSLWHFYFQPICPEGRSGQCAHLGLNHLGLSFLIYQT